MTDKTLEDLIVEVELGLHQAAGISTQVYSETTIASMIKDAFYTFATDPEKRWPRFITFVNYTLDGVNGRTTVPINTTFANYMDILSVYPDGSDIALSMMDATLNPSRYAGSSPISYTYDTQDTIKIIPVTATGDITVVGRSMPTTFENDTVVPFDYLALKYFVCWRYLTDDGNNPGAAENFRVLYESRYQHLSKSTMEAPIKLQGRGSIPRDWFSN